MKEGIVALREMRGTGEVLKMKPALLVRVSLVTGHCNLKQM